jgi:ribosomal protein S18 acetylase RimI-like enzyme
MSPAEPTIAALTPADAAEYRRVRLRALAEQPESFRASAEDEAARSAEWWQSRLAPRSASNAAFYGGWSGARELVGLAGLLFETRPKTRHTATIVGVYVVPECAGRGLGSRLLRACIDAARADPLLEMLYLTVTSTNGTAIRLYERFGFARHGIEPRSMRIGERTFDKALMSLALRPE